MSKAPSKKQMRWYRQVLPSAAFSSNGRPYVMVRIALPENNKLHSPKYYRPDATDGIPWVTVGYKTWPLDEWIAAYGKDYKDDNRNWDFFGEPIDIWEGYSESNSDEDVT